MGSGIFVNEAKDALIDNCTFDSNRAGQGGAIGFENFSQTTDAIKNSVFNNNKAWQGGAININVAVENIVISNSNFTGNKGVDPALGDSSTMGGAIMVGTNTPAGTNIDISGCNFKENNAMYGGAVVIAGDSTGMIDDCTFEANTATYGGAVNGMTNKTLTVEDSTFKDNAATTYGGALMLGPNGNYEIADSEFSGNTADYGNAVASLAELKLSNNTFSDDNPDVRVWGDNGKVITNWNIVVMQGKEYFLNFDTIKLYATVTDDNGNLIQVNDMKFTFNGVDIIDAKWNNTSKQYEANYIPTEEGTFIVSLNAEGDNVNLTTATIRFSRSLSDLANKIASADAGDTIDLDANYAYIEEFDSAYVNGIVIDKALTINGNGHTISGSNAARIFQLYASDININNITFTNGYMDTTSATPANWGGAIYSNGDYEKHIISDCKFYNNTAYNGGAIYLEGDNSKLINCEFEDNEANVSGGAVFLIGWYANITGSTFKNNNASQLGGAVAMYSAKPAVIEGSTFINNAALNGGAVSWQGTAGSITDSTFTENKASGNGGAVFWGTTDEGIITGGEFSKNDATFGGAIFVNENSALDVTSTFTENSAENGGAIALYGNATITQSEFTKNTAQNYGGVIFADEGAKLNITKSTMEDNTATIGNAIYVKDGEVTSQINITVMDNDTYAYSFHTINLYATITDDMGNIIEDSTFKFLVGTDPVDAIYNDTTKVYEGTYTPTAVGEFVVSMSYDTTNLNIKTATVTFAKSLIDIQNLINAASAGDTINLTGDYAYIEKFDSSIKNGIVIDKNITIDGKGFTINGNNAARIFKVNANDVTIKDITIINATSTGRGGAVYVDGAVKNTVISNAHFYNNTAVSGGAIAWDGDNGKLIGSEFKDNKATDTAGAVFWFGDDGNITGSTFEDNTAGVNGGAVAWITQGVGGHNGIIDDSTFINNTASANGGAVFWNGLNGEIKDSNFTENKAPNAGAVYWAGSEGTVSGGKFSKN